ncbi:uncharacterized protein LOC105689917 isoform X2 [Athalia rosae]|uniref:uncharacterized protein LOC105689917 isoform X2 n=1 Tax=Athalia rosae TaxID=37344 RepID=UPI0020337D86|nr:uncharacterized protein LOC105689917 isoform X2 [Athalia rosae]
MAATAKHDLRQNFPTDSTGEEDIAAIAKQISDHAEAIYQTWKSRGLAPTEILNCHSNATAADKFDSVMLTPGAAQVNVGSKNSVPAGAGGGGGPTAAELLAQAPNLDNNNLEKLVNNFVVEDKARLAAASRQKSPSKNLPSSIQFALQKFERNTPQSSPVKTLNNISTATTAAAAASAASANSKAKNIQINSTSGVGTANNAATYANKPSEIVRPQASPNAKSGPAHHSEIFLETIETTFPADLTPARIVVQQKRPSSVVSCRVQDHQRPSGGTSPGQAASSGLTTWPLKNKIGAAEGKRGGTSSLAKNTKVMQENGKVAAATHPARNPGEKSAVSAEVPRVSGSPGDADNAKSFLIADEVAREEERLINALMTGVIIPEETSERNAAPNHVHPSKQKPAIKREKPKVEPVKPIILGHGTNMCGIGSPQNIQILNTGGAGEGAVKLPSKEDLSTMSMVDYAKVRYRAAQQNTTSAKKRNEDQPQTGGSIADCDRHPIHQPHHHHHHHHHRHHHLQNRRTRNGYENENDGDDDDDDDDDDDNVEDEVDKNCTERLVSAARTKFEPAVVHEQNRNKELVGVSNAARKNCAKEKSESKEAECKDVQGTSRWGPRVNSPSRPRLEQLVPHPELTTQQRQHIRAAATGTGNNPVRPFLTRGSVAERVLIFEKCPSELLLDKRGPRQPAINTWRSGHEVQSKAQSYIGEKLQNQKNLPPHTTLQRHVKANRNVLIPRFYFPGGKPVPTSQLDATLSRISAAFQSLPGHRATKTQFHTVTKACDCPLYWKVPLFLAAGGDKNGYVDQSMFLEFWKEWSSLHHDAASRFLRMTTRGLRDSIIPEDLIPLVQDVVETHPGLTFLKEATEFHSRYVHTVVARIFYSVNRSWSGKISVSELRRSNLLDVISVLEHEEDINQVTAYFSYEHFYVIYCKFWELDRDHDLYIDKLDLTRHNDNALSTRMIERIFSGAVTRGGVRTAVIQRQRQQEQLQNQQNYYQNNYNRGEEHRDNNHQHQHHHHHQQQQQQQQQQQPGDNKMSYTEFVWFLLSEEDKNHPTAIEYWFRCMDLDGDGYLSMYELEYFYEEQLHRMEAIGIETLPFEDCLCQMLDMIHPAIPGKISLSDLKKCKMTSIFFDTFFNLEKYLDHEQRDPFASTRDHDADGHELSDWDRFAAEEYELLVAEESGNDQSEQMLCDDEM